MTKFVVFATLYSVYYIAQECSRRSQPPGTRGAHRCTGVRRTTPPRTVQLHDPVRGLRTAEPVDAGVNFLAVAAKVDGLADEGARQLRVRISEADFVGFAAGESGNAKRVGQVKFRRRQ